MIQVTFHPASRRPAGLLRRLGPLAALGLVAVFGASQAAAQEEPLSRREVSRALDTAEEHIDDAERAVRDGDMAAANGAWAQAGGLFLRVLQDYPDRHDVRLEIARIYRNFEAWENVAQSYEMAVAGLDDDDEILEVWIEITNAYAMLENEMKVIEAGQKAIEAGQKVLELNMSQPRSMPLGLAAELASQGQLPEAADMARQALELEPNHALAYSILGQASATSEDWEAAKASIRRAAMVYRSGPAAKRLAALQQNRRDAERRALPSEKESRRASSNDAGSGSVAPRPFESGTTASGKCEIPGYAEGNLDAFDPTTTRLSWCSYLDGTERFGISRVDSVGANAINAELGRCAIELGQVAPDRIASFAATIRKSCDIVEALATSDCRCPRNYYALGNR